MKLFIKLWIGCAVTTLVYTLPVLTLAYPDMVSCKDDTNDVRERFTLYHVVLSHIVLSPFRLFEKIKHEQIIPLCDFLVLRKYMCLQKVFRGTLLDICETVESLSNKSFLDTKNSTECLKCENYVSTDCRQNHSFLSF